MNGIICQVINKLKNILFQRKHSPVASDNLALTTKTPEPLNAKLVSGASKHFFKTTHLQFLRNVTKLNNGPIAYLPNNTQVQATYRGTLPIHNNISKEASEVLIFPHLQNESLLSIGQLCDDNCIVIFTKKKFFVTKMGKCLFEGFCNEKDGLWDFKQATKTKTKQSITLFHKNN